MRKSSLQKKYNFKIRRQLLLASTNYNFKVRRQLLTGLAPRGSADPTGSAVSPFAKSAVPAAGLPSLGVAVAGVLRAARLASSASFSFASDLYADTTSSNRMHRS